MSPRRLERGTAVFGTIITDPLLRAAASVATLGRQASLEATVLAYNDVFLLVGALATGTALYLAYVMSARNIRAWSAMRSRRAATVAM